MDRENVPLSYQHPMLLAGMHLRLSRLQDSRPYAVPYLLAFCRHTEIVCSASEGFRVYLEALNS